MKILALDTSTDVLAVALRTEKGWAEASLDLGLRHAESLMDLVDFCLTRAGLVPADLDLLACALGPGSFTGLRIGMSTVKGMSLALDRPWVAIPTLDTLAWGLDEYPGVVVPVVDGKKGRVYAAIYQHGSRVSDWLDLSVARLAGLLDAYPEALVTGPDAELFESTAMERRGIRLDGRARSPSARGMAELALLHFELKGGTANDVGPLYLRPSEAEESASVNRGEKPGSP